MQGMQGLRGQIGPQGIASGYTTAQIDCYRERKDGTGLAGVQSGLNTLRSGVGSGIWRFGTQGTDSLVIKLAI